MTFHLEYCIAGRFGLHIKVSENLKQLLLEARHDGCYIADETIKKALKWAATAQDGDRFYGGGTFTLNKGKRRMTEYTSL